MIFVDTGAWFARFSRRDQFHQEAKLIWAQLEASDETIVISDSVFVETITLLERKIGAAAAISAARSIHEFGESILLRARLVDEQVALDLMKRFSDQPIGFVDCLSFALMQRHGISTAFSFDRHFVTAGFGLLSQGTPK